MLPRRSRTHQLVYVLKQEQWWPSGSFVQVLGPAQPQQYQIGRQGPDISLTDLSRAPDAAAVYNYSARNTLFSRPRSRDALCMQVCKCADAFVRRSDWSPPLSIQILLSIPPLQLGCYLRMAIEYRWTYRDYHLFEQQHTSVSLLSVQRHHPRHPGTPDSWASERDRDKILRSLNRGAAMVKGGWKNIDVLSTGIMHLSSKANVINSLPSPYWSKSNWSSTAPMTGAFASFSLVMPRTDPTSCDKDLFLWLS